MVNEKVEKKAKVAASSDVYDAFLKSLKLHTINLKDASCNIERDAYWDNKERKLDYKMTAECTETGEDYFDVRAKLNAMVTGKPKIHLVGISATFDLHFHAKEITKALVEKFSNAEFRFIVWPYFREYVSDVSSRMYIPPIILPLSSEQED
jgi:preprotein translocase subunit SecB